MSAHEATDSFACFGGTCSVHVAGDGAAAAVAAARATLLDWHEQFSRFIPDSELARLNADLREEVPASPMMVRLARAVRRAGALTDGLVDATLLEQLERCGYDGELGSPLELPAALALAPPRSSARAHTSQAWSTITADARRGIVRRPPGVAIDSGGLAKGLFADVLVRGLSDHDSVAVSCGGDVALGGSGGHAREVHVESPFDGSTLHTFTLGAGGVATSGIGRRSWLDADGRPAHHLLDPRTGRPAYTGVVQATALAPSALTAEAYAKAAVLSGPRGAARWLPDGGVLVLDDGSHIVFERPTIALADLSRRACAA